MPISIILCTIVPKRAASIPCGRLFDEFIEIEGIIGLGDKPPIVSYQCLLGHFSIIGILLGAIFNLANESVRGEEKDIVSCDIDFLAALSKFSILVKGVLVK